MNMQPAPFSKSPPTFKIELTPAEAIQLREAAIRYRTSPAAMARVGVRQLLGQIKRGAAPLIQPSTNETGVIPEGCDQLIEGTTLPPLKLDE